MKSDRRSQRRRHLFLGSVLAGLLVVASPGIANADTGAAAEEPQISAAEQANLDAVLGATDNSTTVPEFDVSEARSLGATEDAITGYGASFSALGGVVVNGVVPDASTLQPEVRQAVQAAAACTGTTGFTGYYWFGPQTALDSCLTSAFINGISLAAAGGGLYTAASALTVAGLPAAAVTGVVSGVLAVGIVFLNICRDASDVSAIYLNGGIPGVVTPTCWGQ